MEKLYTVVTRIRNDGDAHMLRQCLDSIIQYGLLNDDEFILVVDSCSPAKNELTSVLNLYGSKIGLHNELNSNYEAGAWLKAYKSIVADRYIFLHDSSRLIDYPTESFSQEVAIYKPFDSWEHAYPDNKDWAIEKLKGTPWENIPESFTMVMGSIFSCTKSVLDRLYNNGLEHVLPTVKKEACHFERLLGIVLTMEGYQEQMNKNFLPVAKHHPNRD